MEATMYRADQLVRLFHERNGHPVGENLKECADAMADGILSRHAATLKRMGEEAENRFRASRDLRLRRAGLMLEELGELLQALSERVECDSYDGAMDLAFVTVGTCVSFGWPCGPGFEEVAASNMSKRAPRPEDGDAGRMRDKGPAYVAADMHKLLTYLRACPHEAEYGAVQGTGLPNFPAPPSSWSRMNQAGACTTFVEPKV
jgi:hypothetical protein